MLTEIVNLDVAFLQVAVDTFYQLIVHWRLVKPIPLLDRRVTEMMIIDATARKEVTQCLKIISLSTGSQLYDIMSMITKNYHLYYCLHYS